MKINTIEYFGAPVNMVIVDNCLAIGRITSKTYLVESVFSNESYLDVCTDEEIMLNYGVNVKEISYFTLN